MFRKIPDNFFLGMALGAGVLFLGERIIQAIRLHRYTEYTLPRILHAPKPELIVLLLNIILFRFLILKVRYEQTGKGVLFITVALVMIYYFARIKWNGA